MNALAASTNLLLLSDLNNRQCVKHDSGSILSAQSTFYRRNDAFSTNLLVYGFIALENKHLSGDSWDEQIQAVGGLLSCSSAGSFG